MTDSHSHTFLFEQARWEGEGTLVFSISPETLIFKTVWKIPLVKEDKIASTQTVLIDNVDEEVTNHLRFSAFNKGEFTVELENEAVGYVIGNGIYDEKQISWEFRGHARFEGFEIYHLKEDGTYMVHAEYSSSPQVRTIIDAHIWKVKS